MATEMAETVVLDRVRIVNNVAEYRPRLDFRSKRMSELSPLPFRTKWRPVSPTAEDSKKGIRRALWVVLSCLAVGFLAPVGLWTLASILAGFVALMSIGFDLNRLQTGHLLLERIQFDDRRIERVTRQEPSGEERRTVVAYDALEKADIGKGTLGLYEFGNEWPKEVFSLDEFEDEAMIDELLVRLREKGVLIEPDSVQLEANIGATEAP